MPPVYEDLVQNKGVKSFNSFSFLLDQQGFANFILFDDKFEVRIDGQSATQQ